MSKYIKVRGMKTRAYVPASGELDLGSPPQAVPPVAGDEMYLRLGVPDRLLTGPRMAEFEHNPCSNKGKARSSKRHK